VLKKKTLSSDVVLVDGSSQFFRAFFQLRTLINSKGFPTGAIYGFTNIIRKIIKEFSPRYVAIAWDSHRKIRAEKFKDYKATRRETPDDLKVQIPYIKKIIDAYGFANFEIEGLEADDIIATLKNKIQQQNPDLKIIIITSDKDMMQIVDEKTYVYDPRAEENGDPLFTPEKVKEKFGVRPEQIPDYLALVGDQIDNIPGIKGIGPEGAKKLLEKFNSVEQIFEKLGEVDLKWRRLLFGERQNALLYKELAKLKIVDIEIDIESLKPRPPKIETLIEIFKELEFSSYLKELAQEFPALFDKFDKSKYFLVDSEQKFKELIDKIEKEKFFAFDTETSSLDIEEAKIFGISFAFKDSTSYYIDLTENTEKILEALKKYLEDENYKKVGQNIKFDIRILKKYGIEVKGIDGDSMIAAWMLNPDRTKIGLDELSLIYLGHKTTSYKELTADGKIRFQNVSKEKAKDYCCEDSMVALNLHEKLFELMREKELVEPYKNIELKIIPILADMESAGVKVDREFFAKFGEEVKSQIDQISKRIYEIAGTRFNIDSTQQLGYILFEKLKIELEEIKRTKKTKAYSTDNEVLQEIAAAGYEIGELLLKYRALKKLLSTYILPIPQLVSRKTGRIHTSFNQTKTATGRLSSSDPNLQNIPAKGEEGSKIREGFIADEGNVFVSADYSQIELRVLAHITQDPELIRAFKEGEDIHSDVASFLFQVPKSEVTKDMRRIAKIVNFGIIYGISAHGLKTQAKLPSRHDAQKLIDSYLQRFKVVKEWRENIIKETEKKGFVRTIFGRLRYIPELKSEDKNIRAEGERRAINTPIQGSAADIMKIAMISVWNRLKKEVPEAKIIMQVHDELIVECPEEKSDKVKEILEEEMRLEEKLKFSVPLKVSVKIGKKWSELD